MNTIVSQFEQYASLHPHNIAVTFDDKHWTYAELNHYANWIANVLLERQIKKQAVIAVMGDKSIEMIAGILAILKLNCSYLPVDSSLPKNRIDHMLHNASVNYILCHHSDDNAYDATSIQLNYADFNTETICHNPAFPITPEDAAYIMYTSGTTGNPKGVIVPHRGIIRLLKHTNYMTINENDVVLFHSNTSFDAGIFEIWAALINGARIVISPHMIGDLPFIFELCKKEHITILLLATGLFHIFSNMALEQLTYLRYLVVGGDVMHQSAAIRAIRKNKQMTLINGYGPAENTVFTTCLVIQDEEDISNPVSIGKPITGTQVYVLDALQQPVAEGEIGELYTSGLGVALGYINAPNLTAEKFLYLPHIHENGLCYRTGDLVRILSSGNYEFIGRQDHQIKIRGFRIELTEIETIISHLSFIEDVCICVRGHDNKQLIGFVKIANKNVQVQWDESRILNYLKTKLPQYAVPSRIVVSHMFPLTANGKIDRKILQDTINDEYQFNIMLNEVS